MRETDRGAPLRLRAAGVLLLLVAFVAMAAPASAVRVCTYNVLNFPGSTGTARVPHFRTVIQELDADVLVVQEMLSQAGVNQFLSDVMNYGAPGLYVAGPFVDGYDTDNAIFYKPTVVELVSHSEISTALRNISEYVLRPVGYTSTEAEFRIYSAHLKASSTSSDQAKRLAECTILRDHLNALAGGSSFMLGADLNIRASTEAAYQKLVGSEADNDGRLRDPINTPGTWYNNSYYADVHTQSPRTAQFGGGATGGMDDRFDQLLISYGLYDGEGMDYLPSTYVSFGNDGLHFNMAINSGTNYAVGATVANALHDAADHLPVYADFQVPAQLDAPSALAFGNVAVGYAAMLPLLVENSASAPADELSYTLSIPAGYSGSAGPFELNEGQGDAHDITMNTSTAGYRGGTLEIDSDDPDRRNWTVSLSGTVLDHASPSLASGSQLLASAVDFGSHPEGEFSQETAQVWNDGYGTLQALLNVYAAEIAGGDGRFSFVGGFAPADVGSTPSDFALEFDDQGAATDSLYSATLTFHSRDDQSLAGAITLPDLTVTLTAYVESGTGIADDEVTALALGLASRNPFAAQAELVLSLPEAGDSRLDVYDVRGRLVTTLLSRRVPAGEHHVTWNGTDRAGRYVPSGIYFVRAYVGDWNGSLKLVLLR
ncbi:MAG: choice-of-anchor D domain-containing protein [Candidatus Eisenbacteria bacterium]